MSRTIKILFSNETDLRRDNSPSCSFYRQGSCFDLSHHVMVTRWSRSTSIFYALIGQNFTVSSCGKLVQQLETCLLIAEAGRQRFVSSCDVFNCLFSLDVQNEIQLLSRLFCYSWLVCLLGFWFRNAPLVKVIGNPI